MTEENKDETPAEEKKDTSTDDFFDKPATAEETDISNVSDDDDDALESGEMNLADDVDETDADFKALPAGVYNANLDDFEYKKSSSGNPMIVWIFALDHEDKQLDGRKLYYHTVTNSERGLAQVKRVVNRLGPDKVDTKKWRHDKSPEALVGTRCRLKIAVGKYQGNQTNNIKEIMPASAQGSEFFDKTE